MCNWIQFPKKKVYNAEEKCIKKYKLFTSQNMFQGSSSSILYRHSLPQPHVKLQIIALIIVHHEFNFRPTTLSAI